MHIELFERAMVVGLSIAAPVGPVGLACIQRTLSAGMRAGFLSGLGAATADALYGALGASGISAITTWLVSLRLPLAIVGGLFLCWMGARTLGIAWRPTAGPMRLPRSSGAGFGSVFVLTLANPMTILSFVAVFASLSGGTTTGGGTVAMVAGVFTGSALWWLFLVGIVRCVRQRIDQHWQRWMSLTAGALIAGLGFWQLAMLAAHPGF